MLLALVTFLVPVFEEVFSDFGGELPAITKLTVAHVRPRDGAVVPPDRRHRRRPSSASALEEERDAVTMQWDRFKLKVPMKIGDIVQKVALARFSRTLSALVAAGVPMLEAIEITGRTSGNKVDRAGHGRRARLGAGRRHDRAADGRGARGLPARWSSR